MAVYKSKVPTKDGRSYFFRIKYKDIFGVSHDYNSPKFKTKKEAESEEARYRIKVDNKEAFVSNVTFEKAYYDLKKRKSKKYKQTTIYKDDEMFKLLSVFYQDKINDITVSKVNIFCDYLSSKNYSARYKNLVIGLYKQVIIYSNKIYNTSDSTIKYIESFKDVGKIKEELNFFTYDEYLKFDSVIDDFEYHVFFEILYFLGLRRGECMGLTWKDINFYKKEIKINKTLTTKVLNQQYAVTSPKTKSSCRILPLTDNLLEDLKQLKITAKKYKDYKESWFIFGGSIPYAETTIDRKKNLYCDMAEVKRIRIHDFRHSCASLLINKGASIALVSKYLGHANITVTLNTYTHMYKSELDNMAKILNNL